MCWALIANRAATSSADRAAGPGSPRSRTLRTRSAVVSPWSRCSIRSIGESRRNASSAGSSRTTGASRYRASKPNAATGAWNDAATPKIRSYSAL